MAIYHLTTKTFSRGKGQSAIAAAAYRSGEHLHDEQANEAKAYLYRANRILFTDIMAPRIAPEWVHDRNELWNRAERSEGRKDSRLAREIEISLPHELTGHQREWLVKDFVREQLVRKGYVVDIAIHGPDKGDPRNHHAHLLITERQVGPDGFALEKDATMNRKEQLVEWREEWGKLANRHLERHGHETRIDHRSLKEQGIDREPTTHLGYAAAEMSVRGAQSDRMDDLKAILERNDIRLELKAVNDNLAELERIADAERLRMPDTGTKAARTRKSGMNQEGPGEEELAKQATREGEYLRHMKFKVEEAQRIQQSAESARALEERATQFHRDKELEAEDAKKKKAENEADEKGSSGRDGDISSASARYAIAIGDNYDVRDPYASLARAAGAEYAMFHRNQEKLRAEMAAEPDTDKRRIIELRMKIEGCEYMAVTNDRLAGISTAVTGREDNAQGLKDRGAAQTYRDMAAELRKERGALIEATQQRDGHKLEPGKTASLAELKTGHAAADLQAAPSASPAPAPSAPANDPQAAKVAAKAAAPEATLPEPANTPQTPSPGYGGLKKDHSASVQVKKPDVTVTVQVSVEPTPPAPSRYSMRADQSAAGPAKTNASKASNEVQVIDSATGRTSSLTDYVRDNPRPVEPEPTRPSIRQILNDPLASKARHIARLQEIKQNEATDKSLSRIGQDMESGKPVKGEDLKNLNREQWERVSTRGDRGLREVVKEANDKTQTQSQGMGRKPPDT